MQQLFGFVLLSLATANHPKHHDHHHGMMEGHGDSPQFDTIVSSFSHKLPGNSFMSVHRVFQVPVSQAVQRQPKHFRQQQQSPFHPQHRAQTDNFNPFNPRFAIPRVEATDEEWEAELEELFVGSGLLDSKGGALLKQVPKGLVNLNYGIHTCVHMGTELEAEESAYPPTALSYPSSTNSNRTDEKVLHTVVMVDLERSNFLHWMVTNVPGARIDMGHVVTAYKGPNPQQGTGTHRYAVIAMEQKKPLFSSDYLQQFQAKTSCHLEGRNSFDLETFKANQQLNEPVAANYFRVQYDPFVDNINGHCLENMPLKPSPLLQ